MPFKKFPDEEGEARTHSVAFGPSAPPPNASNGNASLPFKKSVDSDAKQADGFVPRPNLADNTRGSSRNKSPSRVPAVARASSPSRTSPVMNGMISNSPPSFISIAHDQAVQTDPGLSTFLPSYHSMANTGRLFQKSPVLIDNDLSKSSSKLHVQDANMPPAAPSNILNTQNLPTLSMRNSSETRERKTRHSSTQEPASRFFASAIQQSKATEDGSAASLSAEQQRDEMAKGRRLRRFNDSIAKGTPVIYQFENQSAVDQVTNKRAKGGNKLFTTEAREDMQDNSTEPEVPDSVADRDLQSTELILGNCPDMCPESERLERERKGDLDRLERLDGDRNQTNRDLAVKKYTRTAEKHASLIRPISVLLKTMKHLLHLLNRKYDEELLNLHNFLWDRMRAIRMDLRMQHIFNQQAVAMHEQMIRFHILAMHELCEYAKGEGFSEGFDAHLNIEQMNKASVDLFHMYDDLRKSGNLCVSEAEFRGYYALLKLDKHPGYVVEPAELSLDLTKMTPEMRNTPEVQFARKVARACRSGNYLAFFRLARDATYLQACLMHAHFSKVRSQAMASLHSGLQRNQGIPIVQVEDWLGLEGEDIEAFLEYHGFSLKNYEEPYMVKEGPFVNQGQQAFQTRRSKLVKEKRSQIVKDDVLSSGQDKTSTAPVLERISSLRRQSDLQPPTDLATADEEMPDYEEDEQPQESLIDHVGVFSRQQGDEPLPYGDSEMQVPVPVQPTTEVLSSRILQESYMVGNLGQDDNEWFEMGKRRKSMSPFMEHKFVHKPDELFIISRDKKLRTSQDPPVTASSPAAVVAEVRTQFVETGCHQEEKERQEASKAELNLDKVRLLLRKWRARAAYKAEERQWRQEKLEAALCSFHVGLPVQSNEKVFFSEDIHANHAGPLSGNAMDLDFMQTEDRRSDKIKRMWTELDVIEVVASVLKHKNPSCKFLCWKLVMYSHVHDLDLKVEGKCDKCGEWLLAKILQQMPFDSVSNEGIFSTGITDDSVYVARQHNEIKTPVIYIARDLQFRDGEMQDLQACRGASGILFLVSENAPLGEQRGRLYALVKTLQSGVKLPLLVVYSKLSESTNLRPLISYDDDDAGALAKILDLDNLDKSKVSCWTVLPIMESYETLCPINVMESPHEGSSCLSSGTKSRGFYSEDLLKKGLSWLASRAPMQPNLRCVPVQDLVIEHLQLSVKLLSKLEPAHVTPEMCVKTFNEALLKTANEVHSAATDCHFHWPPDELRKVFEKLVEGRTLSLPSPGWNEATYLRPIIEALSLSQLPEFPVISISTRSLGSNVSLNRQKAALENMLQCYVNQVCGSKHADPLTLQVVDAVIQNGCVFKQTALGRLLIPNWSLIFQQLYHIRLALLSSEPPAVVWVQIRAESHESLGRTMSPDSTKCLGPTLDEMIEMESQEIFLQRDFNSIHVFEMNRELMDVEMKGHSPLFMVSGMNTFGDSRHESTQELQKAASRVTPEFTEVIEVPTEGELELESMVSEFCRRVDQQVAEAAHFEEGQAIALYEAKYTNDKFISSTAGNERHEITKSNIFADSCVDDASSYVAPSNMWATSDGMGSLTQLLQHCENVQNSIDRTLRECFRMGEPTWH